MKRLAVALGAAIALSMGMEPRADALEARSPVSFEAAPAQLVPGKSYVVLTIDGKVYSGVLTKATETTIDLELESGRKVSIARKEIEEVRAGGKK
jgi:hypothetical protein